MPLWPWRSVAIVDKDGASLSLSLSFEVSPDGESVFVWLLHDATNTTWRGQADAIGQRLSPEDAKWLKEYTPLHPNEQYHWDWEELPKTKISAANLYHNEVIWMNPRNRTAKLMLRGVHWPVSLTDAFTLRVSMTLEHPQYDGSEATMTTRAISYCFEMEPAPVSPFSPTWIPVVTTAKSICSSFADSYLNWEIVKPTREEADIFAVEDGLRVDQEGAYEITLVVHGSYLASINSRLLSPRVTRTIGGQTLSQYRTELRPGSVFRVLMVEANDDESSLARVTFRQLAGMEGWRSDSTVN
ncbi:hypothetical protein P43SY_010663 [Pythium insidiosum]|uniref:Uncharacterized protein n=1 Tax=Pythium insidiosum TaxID=114742 RepID=A0AAD5Q2U7_PYTIN|nr:hypothetical protein P43SY_010663 [Pythium insidiosum]